MIKPISYYHYGVVVYGFTHLKKWNIQSLLKKKKIKLYVKIHIKKKSICKVFINLKDNEKSIVNN